MNASASCGVSTPAADANQAAAAPHSDDLANPLNGWMAAYDACVMQSEAGEWGVTFAESIKRAIAAGDTKGAERLADIQQFVFDHVFSNAQAGMAEPLRNMGTLQARGPQ